MVPSWGESNRSDSPRKTLFSPVELLAIEPKTCSLSEGNESLNAESELVRLDDDGDDAGDGLEVFAGRAVLAGG